MEARAHPLQAERLKALYSYEVLDTDPEKEFDDVIKLAAQTCGTAISVVNLIDAERQWFKAEVGLGVRETPLATSICSHVILEDDFVEIGDTLLDPRMIDNPLCCGEPGLRFYAGALLRSDHDLPIGTLCVLDWQPRILTPLQRDTIRVLARQVMAQLDLRRALRSAALLRQEVDHRVKNSLMSLSSLAGIQARATASPEARAALSEIQGRIKTVSMLHELLYKTDAGARIELGSYVAHVGDYLQAVAPDAVCLHIEADPVMVNSHQAAAVGTLINEFAANSFKHAFPDGRAGRVSFLIRRQDDGTVLLECADDGIGLQARTTGARNPGLGMKIVEATARQLGGRMHIPETGRGLTIRVGFRPHL